MHGYAKKGMDDFILFHGMFSFEKCVLFAIFQSNWHLLILDNHGSHATIKALEQTLIEFGLDVVTLHLTPHMPSNPWTCHVSTHLKQSLKGLKIHPWQ